MPPGKNEVRLMSDDELGLKIQIQTQIQMIGELFDNGDYVRAYDQAKTLTAWLRLFAVKEIREIKRCVDS